MSHARETTLFVVFLKIPSIIPLGVFSCHIVKLEFTGVYIIFLISSKNIDCGYALEPPRGGGSNEYQQSMFLSRNMKKI